MHTNTPETVFSVHGPFEMPCQKNKASKSITTENTKQFWKENEHFRSKKGCYIFALKAARGYTPYYIGKTKKSFSEEIFKPHKLNKYHSAFADRLHGKPVFFFVLPPSKRGKVNAKHIAELERFLIQTGANVNPNLVNVRGTKPLGWAINGVIRNGKGMPSKGATHLKKCLKI